MDTIVTRFAPSPTGYLHIGGIRTALINYILVNQSKKTNSDSKFILRIEDTDKKRSKKEYVNSIVEGLKWLGIEWDDQILDMPLENLNIGASTSLQTVLTITEDHAIANTGIILELNGPDNYNEEFLYEIFIS